MDTSSILGSRSLEIGAASEKPSGSTAASEAFGKTVSNALASANEELNRSEAAARELAAGKGDLVETMIAMGRADLSLRLVVNLRNRMLESYNEIMRLQV